MRTLIRLAIIVGNFAVWLLILWAIVGCSRVQYYPVESLKTDSIYIKQLERDSIYLRDSIFVYTKADTVFYTQTRYKYKEIIIHDTVSLIQRDTTTVVREVERQLTKVQQLKMDIGAGVMTAVPILIAVGLFVLYRKLRK